MNTYNAPLLEVGCHDDDLTIVVPHHSPKVFYCVLQWTLRRNVLLGVVAVALGGVCGEGRGGREGVSSIAHLGCCSRRTLM